MLNFILLSGGSGKRLWPLSNDVRSKQFIKLFKNQDGTYESMIQRVFRQLSSANKNANIVIATSKSQVSAIRNQLGNDVSVCVEPCRRDTFPAIALSAAYLKYELGMDEQECIAICPVDHFVDESYYSTVEKMEKLVSAGSAKLTLMGIEPTYPSEKYGYIIPENSDFVSSVSEFKEKPDKETAQRFIESGALWNAGVFAFKLGYILEKAHSLIEFTDYRDLYSRYEKLPKISFDYAVVEAEKSIQVMRYSGEWKDVGTWNIMSEVMSDKTKGNVTMDETCENTQVINELDISVLCMGCKDMIVAVSGDGILISDKERSGYMKPFVEKIRTDVHFAEKSWGTYTLVDVQSGSATAKIFLLKGKRMKYHSHELRSEAWNIISGNGRAVIDGEEIAVSKGDVVQIKAGSKHTLIAETDMTIIEVQVGSEIDRKDKTVHDFTLKNH